MLKLGIIGFGRMARVHYENVNSIPNAQVIAIADVMETQALTEGKFPLPSFTTDYNEVIKNPEVDAILICSPSAFHPEQILACVKAGKAVFCEKPLAMDFNVGETVRKIIEAKKHFVMFGFNRRFDSGYRKIKNAITKGKIGNLHTIHITTRNKIPPTPAYVKTSGGLFMDMTIHDFDLARFLADSEVKQVFAKGNCLIDPEIGKLGDIDTAVVVLTFENGAIGTISNSRKAVYGEDQRAEAFGSEGQIRLENKIDDNYTLHTSESIGSSLTSFTQFSLFKEAYKNEIQEFVDCVLNGKPSPVTVADAQKAAAIAQAAKESLQKNSPVDIISLCN